MGCAHKENQFGFTLVEISIVMIIIGLLIGGTFGGMQLIESGKVTKTASELKSYDAGGLTFRDTYGRLPGDIRTPATRLPNCTALPCSTGGNGDRMVGGNFDGSAITATSEQFLFWQHMLAADLISNVKPVSDLTFGEGQPDSPLDSGGYRMIGISSIQGFTMVSVGKHVLWASENASDAYAGVVGGPQDSILCDQIRKLDVKMDDGNPSRGRVVGGGLCTDRVDWETWTTNNGQQGGLFYQLAF
jgi:prepilin-type N-terminal cleavage/methylation domain-containing protein